MTRVLVVEDEESFVEALTIGLAREGFRVLPTRKPVAITHTSATTGHRLVLSAHSGGPTTFVSTLRPISSVRTFVPRGSRFHQVPISVGSTLIVPSEDER